MNVSKEIVFRKEFDGSALLFNGVTGETFGLNRTSTFLWEKFAEGMDAEAALAALKEVCGGNLPESAADDVAAFIAQLKEKNYLI